jgi:hypothetical protein
MLVHLPSLCLPQIYNETLRDLLGGGDKLDIRRGRDEEEVHVPDLVEMPVASPEEVAPLLARASANRAVARTDMNERSSRSHSVFRLRIVGSNPKTGSASFWFTASFSLSPFHCPPLLLPPTHAHLPLSLSLAPTYSCTFHCPLLLLPPTHAHLPLSLSCSHLLMLTFHCPLLLLPPAHAHLPLSPSLAPAPPSHSWQRSRAAPCSTWSTLPVRSASRALGLQATASKRPR